MKLFFSEFNKDYGSYTFSYAPYCVYENREEIPQIYAAGFLPYTGDIQQKPYLYYMARSLRVPLEAFTLSSENRRVARKIEPFCVESEWMSMQDFDWQNRAFTQFCLNYCKARFKSGEMSEERLQYVLQSPFATDIIRYKIEGVIAGYVLVSMDQKTIHYWYSFYTLSHFQDLPLGKFLMMDVICQSKARGLDYIYLGTCYGNHSLYKVRDFKPVEFFDGKDWQTDIKTLKSWCKSDDIPLEKDRFKIKPKKNR